MKLNEFLEIDIEDLMNLSIKELRDVANVGASAANRRIKLIENANVGTPPAVANLPESMRSGINDASNNTRKQLLSKIRSTRQFLSDPTSTVSGFRKATQTAADRIDPEYRAGKSGQRLFDNSGRIKTMSADGGGGRKYTAKAIGKFWDVYHRYDEIHSPTREELYRIRDELMPKFFENADLRHNVDRLFDEFEDFFDKTYQEEESEISSGDIDSIISNSFGFDDDDEGF